ncbi:MAG: D-alanine--D-alanine ligase family protein [Bacteroidota bacterium]|nr:D-alanine--D-alanine ligase family protein [Bacteroidota bacterium]
MKTTVALIFGGKSTEHEVSLMSTINVLKNLDKDKFEAYLIYINKNGAWFHISETEFITQKIVTNESKKLSLILDENKFKFKDSKSTTEIDVAFPVLHGPNGEDGSVQGFLEVSNIAFVGPGILGSSTAMDKDIAKILFKNAGIEIAKYLCFRESDSIDLKNVFKELGSTVVIKPVNAGSSVGISKAENISSLEKAIKLAFEFDKKIIIEEYIDGRELEIAVIGNNEITASPVGEIVTEFYDYHEKYSSESRTRLDAPAKNLNKKIIKKLQETAIKAFKALECEGMSRVDFFLTNDKIIINEINTIPGFTNISMYPKLFELNGFTQKELITKLLELAIEINKNKNKLKNNLE